MPKVGVKQSARQRGKAAAKKAKTDALLTPTAPPRKGPGRPRKTLPAPARSVLADYLADPSPERAVTLMQAATEGRLTLADLMAAQTFELISQTNATSLSNAKAAIAIRASQTRARLLRELTEIVKLHSDRNVSMSGAIWQIDVIWPDNKTAPVSDEPRTTMPTEAELAAIRGT